MKDYEMDTLQAEAFMELSVEERRFCLALLAGRTGRQAIRDGWGKDNGGDAPANVKKRPRVKRFLFEMQRADVSPAIMQREEALARLSRIARTSLDDVIETSQINYGTETDPDIQTLWQLRDDPEALSAIASLSAGPNGPKVGMHDPIKAIRQLAEMCGWNYRDKDEELGQPKALEGEVIDMGKLSNEALAEIVMTKYARKDAAEQ